MLSTRVDRSSNVFILILMTGARLPILFSYASEARRMAGRLAGASYLTAALRAHFMLGAE